MSYGDPVHLPGTNPTIAAIDAGHQSIPVHGAKGPDALCCRYCQVPWPCPLILAARRATAARTDAALHPRTT